MSLNNITRDDIIGLEPKHVTYVRDQNGRTHDCLVVKEVAHLKNGEKVKNLRLVRDYRRPFWITQKGRRNHKDKKDYELARNCDKYSCLQIELAGKAARLLGDFKAGPNPPLKRVARSPYLYGADVTSSCLIKADYRKKYGNLVTLNHVGGCDIETNVHTADEEIICASLTHKSNAVLYYLRSWISDIDDLEAETLACADQYIGETLKERGIQLEVRVVDTPGEIVKGLAEHAHKWSPEFVSFWNIDFDMTKLEEALQRENINAADVFSDPSIPPEFRYFEYRRGPVEKETASGKHVSINFEDRWNWVIHPANFQFIDAMPVYRNLRLADGKESSYGLDAILDKVFDGKLSKLKFEETAHLNGLRWHEVMQKDYRVKYAVYNVFDSITLELLDEKTNDLSSKISTQSKYSDYRNFNSNPKRLCDDMHFWYLERDEPGVIGTSSDQMRDELDDYVIGHENWIFDQAIFMMYYVLILLGLCPPLERSSGDKISNCWELL